MLLGGTGLFSSYAFKGGGYEIAGSEFTLTDSRYESVKVRLELGPGLTAVSYVVGLN